MSFNEGVLDRYDSHTPESVRNRLPTFRRDGSVCSTARVIVLPPEGTISDWDTHAELAELRQSPHTPLHSRNIHEPCFGCNTWPSSSLNAPSDVPAEGTHLA
jgi:hypothetical protein